MKVKLFAGPQHQHEPVFTKAEFILPLNAMLYASRKVGPLLIKFSQAVRELVEREHP
jgi:hypothetical protein